METLIEQIRAAYNRVKTKFPDYNQGQLAQRLRPQNLHREGILRPQAIIKKTWETSRHPRVNTQ